MWSSTAPFYSGLYVSFVVGGGYQTSCEFCDILLYFNERGGEWRTRAEHELSMTSHPTLDIRATQIHCHMASRPMSHVCCTVQYP